MRVLGYHLDGDAYCADCAPAGCADNPLAYPIFSVDEGDCPTNCVKCEDLIRHALTTDGLDYIRGAREDLALGMGRPEIVKEWAEAYLA